MKLYLRFSLLAVRTAKYEVVFVSRSNVLGLKQVKVKANCAKKASKHLIKGHRIAT